MNAFYFTGITDFQDMFTTLLSSLKMGKKCWVCIFDCLREKRQFYYYDKKELIDFVQEVCKQNNLPIPEIDFFGQKDEAVFKNVYNLKKPEYVFIQNTWHKAPLWYPTARASKVIQYAWGQDSVKKINQSMYKVFLTVLRREEDVSVYKKCDISAKYFGDLKIDSLQFTPVLQTVFLPENKQKYCYIPESFLRKDSNFKKIAKFTDKLFLFLRENNFYTIWKKREKGYPKSGSKISWASPLDYTAHKPDLIIEKDLNFPSSILYLPKKADICVLVGWSSSYHIAESVNDNIVVLNPLNKFQKEIKKKYGNFFATNTKACDVALSASTSLLNYLEN